jgi:hypothetical protein
MKRPFIVFGVLIAAIIFAGVFSHVSSAARRDAFEHRTAAHRKINCSSCHKLPTGNWVGARGYPDVADFPGHASCINCHRGDFFSGNRPTICAGCHVNPGPRGVGRFAFPVKSRSHEFATIFPHNVHQDIIASKTQKSDVAVAHFVNASFQSPLRADDKPEFNNCAICHKTRSAMPKIAARTPANEKPLADAVSETFAPTAAFFKDMPTGHATCFACHFQGVKPTGTNCAGCHSLTPAYRESAVLKRYSFKFDHNQKEHAIRDCMTCHVRIAQNASVKTLVDADVPFMACVSCHVDKISEESGKRAESIAGKQPAFQCTYCHTPAVGRFPMPASHENR